MYNSSKAEKAKEGCGSRRGEERERKEGGKKREERRETNKSVFLWDSVKFITN